MNHPGPADAPCVAPVPMSHPVPGYPGGWLEFYRERWDYLESCAAARRAPEAERTQRDDRNWASWRSNGDRHTVAAPAALGVASRPRPNDVG